MKTKRIAATLAVALSSLAVQSANAQDLSAMASLACEATLCLSTGQPPTECTPSLNKYFSIVFSKPWKTIQARGNFLKLCPDVQADDAQRTAEQSVSQSERNEAAQTDKTEAEETQTGTEAAQPPKEQIQAALDSLTPVYNSHSQQSVAARKVLESCIAQQGTVESGHCQEQKNDFDTKRAPAITLRAEIARLETMLGNSAQSPPAVAPAAPKPIAPPAATSIEGTPLMLPVFTPPGATPNLLAPAPSLHDIYVPAGASISAEAKAAQPGTTIHVAAGTYNENVNTGASGTAADRIRFVSDGVVKIIGTGTEGMWTNSGNYVDIVGFDISGSGRLGILNNGSNTLIANNHVHNLTVSGGCTGNGGAGIDNANYNAANGDIVNNLVNNIGTPGKCNGIQGIYSSNPGGTISGNTVYNVSAWGIQLWHAATNVTIANNTVYQNGAGGMGGGIVMGTGDAPGGKLLSNTSVVNNKVYDNAATGIAQYCYTGQACIGSGNTVADNLVYGNGNAITMLVGSASGTITNPASTSINIGAR